MSTELKPMELKDITLMSKLKSRMQEANPAISSIRMAAKSLNDSNAQDIPDDDNSDRVVENGVSDGKDAEEDEMKGENRDVENGVSDGKDAVEDEKKREKIDPKGKKLCDQLPFRFGFIPRANKPA